MPIEIVFDQVIRDQFVVTVAAFGRAVHTCTFDQGLGDIFVIRVNSAGPGCRFPAAAIIAAYLIRRIIDNPVMINA